MAATILTQPDVSPTVLLGCSDPGTTQYLTELLDRWHYPVEVAENGANALRRMQGSTPPEIALLDVSLATPGGVEIAWAVRRRQTALRSWMILLSDRGGKDRVRVALEAGCDDFLVIPPDPDDFKVHLRVAERVLALQHQVQKQSAELRYRATHDGLTGLWNREALLSLVFQETDRVQRMKTPLSLLLMDLDDFSRINHDYGYDAGDRVLTELANRFRRQLRSYDLVGRCGEDEFLLALPGCTRENAMALADRVREAILARPFAVNGEASTLTASFGVADSAGRSPLVVLREAERALAEAKLDGKNCARCHASATPLGMALMPESADEAAEGAIRCRAGA
ncbi:MAG: diguanylate cyclase [Acidobacteriaceae bacterium]